jgi:hypothetical protein
MEMAKEVMAKEVKAKEVKVKVKVVQQRCLFDLRPQPLHVSLGFCLLVQVRVGECVTRTHTHTHRQTQQILILFGGFPCHASSPHPPPPSALLLGGARWVGRRRGGELGAGGRRVDPDSLDLLVGQTFKRVFPKFGHYDGK